MRQSLPRVPKGRIAVLIGVKGVTARSLHKASGCKEFKIDSETGDVDVLWGEPGSYDPVKAMKLPEVIKAIGRGMAPMAAIRLLQDDHFFELVELREFVGKRANHQRRIRARIRKLIEGLTNTEITIYKSTVVLVGHEEGLAAARVAIEMIAGGAEHGTVLNFLEKDRRRSKLASRSLDSIELKGEVSSETVFENLVPGLADLSNKRNRKMRASQVDPEDSEAVDLMMELGDGESITYSEEE
jgi:ribosomal RNA assembly protein